MNLVRIDCGSVRRRNDNPARSVSEKVSRIEVVIAGSADGPSNERAARIQLSDKSRISSQAACPGAGGPCKVADELTPTHSPFSNFVGGNTDVF